MDYIDIADNADLRLEIAPANKWIWKLFVGAGLCMSIGGGLAYFPFKGEDFYSEGTLSILFSIFIIGIICLISGMIPYKFLSSYYIINKRMKQIIHYEKFFHKEWIKNVIYFNYIKKIEIQGKETYSHDEDSHSYTKQFWISLILKDGRELKLSNEQSEILYSKEIITEKNVEDVSFNIDYEKIKPVFCKKYSYKGDVIDDLYNLNFTKEEIIQLLYLPPEKLITTGQQIAEILGCDFLSFGKFNFYHDCKQNQTLNLYDTDKLNKSILNLPSENTGIIKKDDKKEKLEEIVSIREEMLEKESKKLSFTRIHFLFFVILLDLLLGMSIIYPSTNPDEKFSLCMVIFIIMLNLLVISGFIPNRKKLKNESKN